MRQKHHPARAYLSLILLFAPSILFAALLFAYKNDPKLAFSSQFPFFGWQFWLIAAAGSVATAGGVLDWRFHRDPLKLQLSKKERDAEAAALGLGGMPMFALMWAAMMSERPEAFLIPILVVLIWTVSMICYDEFVFHIHRCGPTETRFHRMLVFGNGLAWLAWMHFIFCR